MDRQAARDYIFNQPLKQKDIATPFWPELDGHVAIQDVPGDASMNWDNPDKFPGGLKAMIGEMLCKTLVLKDTGELILPLTDRDAIVSQLGLKTLMPIFKEINTFLGLGESAEAALEDAKKN